MGNAFTLRELLLEDDLPLISGTILPKFHAIIETLNPLTLNISMDHSYTFHIRSLRTLKSVTEIHKYTICTMMKTFY